MRVGSRALNDCTPDASWPIPNISEMLRRIGSCKPKNFGIMDLTQGYHQSLLSLSEFAKVCVNSSLCPKSSSAVCSQWVEGNRVRIGFL